MKNYMMRNVNDSPEAMFQNVYDKIFSPIFYDENRSWMKTDVKETDDQYIMEIELPGFKKENSAIDYEAGYVTINASRESTDSNDKFICKERCVKCSRSYYVGYIDSSEIKASYEDGILKLEVPKENPNSGKKGIQIN